MATGLTVGTSGGNKDATEVYVGTSGGNKLVQEIYVGTSGGNKLVFQYNPLTADASPNSQSWTVTDGPDLDKDGIPDSYIYSATVLVTASGGQAPYNYAWSQLTGTAVDFLGSDTSAEASFVGSGGTCTFRCAVTDNLGTIVNSDTVTVA